VQIETAKIKDTIIENTFNLKDIEITNSFKEKVKVISISGNYQLYRIDANDIHAKVNFSATVSLPCSCCTEIFNLKLSDSFAVIYTNRLDYTEGEVTLKDADLDMKFFDGEVLDLEEEIINNFLLALPISPICNSSCKGLCPDCGINLNRNKCNCENNKKDPRWKALETFINNKE
jgi:uncharacterized protein